MVFTMCTEIVTLRTLNNNKKKKTTPGIHKWVLRCLAIILFFVFLNFTLEVGCYFTPIAVPL